jgi:hypothetical protein
LEVGPNRPRPYGINNAQGNVARLTHQFGNYRPMPSGKLPENDCQQAGENDKPSSPVDSWPPGGCRPVDAIGCRSSISSCGSFVHGDLLSLSSTLLAGSIGDNPARQGKY